MPSASTFKIYNASAGSGKTFTLVKEYLKIILQTEDRYAFQHILAVTFTNKAAFEMKERVLTNLQEFSRGESSPMWEAILEELNVDSALIQLRSQQIIEAILQNYTAFGITTIDSFTHKIIKSFAYDLGLPQRFDVEMDAEELLKESIDMLIAKIGVDKDISSTLVQYAKDKSDDDRSWDISHDLLEFSKMLTNEDHVRHLQKIEGKNLSDFEALSTGLKLQNRELKKDLIALGKEGLESLHTLGLHFTDFYSQFFPKLLLAMSKIGSVTSFKLNFTETLDKIFDQERDPYPKKTSEAHKQIIDAHFTTFQYLYHTARKHYRQLNFNRLFLKSIIPLATLKYVYHELSVLKEENGLQLNAEFNQLVSKHIQDQPAPFIYERIGNRYRHYFIDEMQDTSVLQWQNMIPLLHNTLSQENGSLLLVGDGKQSIYRWRGGNPDQFVELSNPGQMNPLFAVPKQVSNLETNFRSHQEIVAFNNHFFEFSAQYLQHASFRRLYQQTTRQLPTDGKKGGFVSIDFVNRDTLDEENNLRYAKHVGEILTQRLQQFSRSECCVIVRKRKDGVLLAEYLTSLGIPIVSSESLLLKNSPKVRFLIDLLYYSIDNTDAVKFRLLTYLYQAFSYNASQHEFFTEALEDKNFFANTPGFAFDFRHFIYLPIYEKLEYAIQAFDLLSESDAYVQFFLDEVLRWQQRELGVQDMLEFWEVKKDKLSIVSPESSDAVSILTIHKSKGLEFPVVIFAGDVSVYEQKNPKVWLGQSIKDFDDFLIPWKSQLADYSDHGKWLYESRRHELEIDALNLLYVALTRAKEQLYVVTDNARKVSENPQYFSQFFKNFLVGKGKNIAEETHFEFGVPTRISPVETNNHKNHSLQVLPKFPLRTDHQIDMVPSSSRLWGSRQKTAIDKGNLLHHILAEIYTAKDISKVLERNRESGFVFDTMASELVQTLDSIVYHPLLQPYFAEGIQVYNERVLTDLDGQLLIPDRLVFLAKEVVIIDYKTGVKTSAHEQQLLRYERVLKTMGYQQVKKVLVYTSNPVHIEVF